LWTQIQTTKVRFIDLGSALRNNFAIDDIMKLPAVLGNFELVWNTLKFDMNDQGAGASIGIAFENPTPLELALIDSIEFYLQLEGTNAVKVTMRRLGLEPLLNKQFQLVNFLSFIDPKIDLKQVQTAIETATKNFAETGNFNFGVVGPFVVSKAGFVSTITQDLKVTGTLKDLLPLVPQFILDILKDPTVLNTPENADAVKSILGSSKISLQVLSDKLQGDFGIRLPSLSFLKPPKDISFPYQTTLSVYGDNVKAIQVDANPVALNRVESGGINIETGGGLVLVNTAEAADGLAKALNPILAADPVPSSIGLKDFAFFLPGQPHFKWCDALFGERILTLGVPAIDKEMLIDGASGPLAQGILRDFSALVTGVVDLAQLSDRPGFGARGNVQVAYPPGLPELRIDIGFFRIDTTVESIALALLELPTGLKFQPTPGGVGLNGVAVLTREQQLPEKIQKLADALLKDSALPSYAGVTGLRFGTSVSQNFQTFSKIIVDVKSTTMVKVAKKFLGDSEDALGQILGRLPAGMVKMQGLDFAVTSSTDVSLRIQSTLNNPFPVTLSVGTVDLSALLDDQNLSGVTVSPIRIATGTSPLNLNVNLKTATGANGMDQKVAAVVNAVLNKDFASRLLAGVTSLRLVPEGGSQGAIIDQLSSLRVGVPVGPPLRLVLGGTVSTGGSPLDISALVPQDPLNQFNPQVRLLLADAQPGSRMNAGGNIGYTNPVPISIRLPYAAASTSLDGSAMVDAEISAIQLDRSGGTMQPRFGLVFKKNPVLPDSVAKLTSNLLQGRLESSIGISGVFFGASATDRNDLLSAISIDASPFLAPFAHLGTKVGDVIGQFGTVQTLSKRQQQAFLEVNGPFGTALSVNSVDVSFQPGSVIGTTVTGGLRLPFPVEINIPYFKAGADIDDVHAGSLEAGITARGENPALNLNSRIIINDVEPLADKVAILSNAFLRKETLPGNALGGKVVFGVSAQDNIDLFSKIGLGINIDKVVTPYKGLIDLENINLDPAGLGGLTQRFGISFAGLGIAARQGRTMEASGTLGFSNPFPITVNGLNFISSSAAIDDIDFVNLRLPGIPLSRGTNNLRIATNAQFPSEQTIRSKVSQFGKNLSSNFGKTTEKLAASRILFGVSESDHIKILSKARFGVSSGAILNQKTLDSVLKLVPVNGTGVNVTEILASASVDVEMQRNKQIATLLQATVNLPLTATVDLPFSKFGSTLDETAAFELGLRNFKVESRAGNPSPIALNSVVGVNDTEDLAAKIARVVRALLRGEPLPGKIGGGSLLFGVSPEDAVDTFSEFNLSLDLQPLAGPIIERLKASATGIDLNGLLQRLGLNLSSLGAVAKEKKTLSTSVEASFNNPFKLSVKGLNYFSASGGINGQDLLSFKAPGVALTPGPNSLKIALDLIFSGAEAAKQAATKFADEISVFLAEKKEPAALLTGSGLKFGLDEQNAFIFLSRSVLGLPSNLIVNEKNLKLVLDRINAVNSTSLLGMVKPESLDVEFTQTKLIDSKVKANVTVPFSVRLDMPFVKVGSELENVPFADVSILGTQISGQGNNGLSLGTSINVKDSDPLADVIAKLTSAILQDPKNVPGTLKGGYLSFGVDSSPENVIDTFSGVALSVKAQQAVDIGMQIVAGVNTTSIDPMELIRKFELSLKNIKANSAPNRMLQTSVTAGFRSPFPISVKGLGYMNALSGVDQTSVVGFGAEGFAVTPGINNLDLKTNLNFPAQAADKVAQFANNIQKVLQSGGDLAEILFATQIKFGFDERNAFQFLSKAKLGVPAKAIIRKEFLDQILAAIRSTPFDPESIIRNLFLKKVHVTTASQGELLLALNGGLQNASFSAEASVGYVKSTSLLNGLS
jgi:hypothetical protein